MCQGLAKFSFGLDLGETGASVQQGQGSMDQPPCKMHVPSNIGVVLGVRF